MFCTKCDLLFGHYGHKYKRFVSCGELPIPDLVEVALGIVLLSVTVFEIFNFFICIENPIPTRNFGGFGGKTPQNRDARKFLPQKALPYVNSHLLSHFGHF